MTPLKANELRKGNLFDYHKQVVHVMDIVTSGIDKPKASFGYFIDSIGFERFLHHEDCPKPLPLTPELLERFGFMKVDEHHYYMNNGYLEFRYFPLVCGLELVIECQALPLYSHHYAHQLQNLYFALTGNELTLTPKAPMTQKEDEIKQTPKEFRFCPSCGMENTLSMKEKLTTSIKGNKVVKGLFEVWTCSKCGEGFFNNWTLQTTNK